jgi:hypothetical protein
MPAAVVAAFLVGHGLIHGSYLAPRPPAKAGGPAWPFELGRSWLLTRLGMPARWLRTLGTTLVVATIAGFAAAALAALGLAPGLWTPGVVLGAVASLVTLGVYFHPWLVLGIAIDIALLWGVSIGVTPDVIAG